MDKKALLNSVLAGVEAPVFLAAFDPSGSKIVLDVASGHDTARLKSKAASIVEEASEAIRVSVRAHNLRRLAFPRSLEHWLSQFDVGVVLHDPTLVLTRARALVSVVKACREVLGKRLDGFFFDPDRRVLFALTGSKVETASIAALRTRIVSLMDVSWDQTEQLPISVEVVADLPRRKLIPVDARSAAWTQTIGRTIRRWLAPGALAIAVTTVAVPAAAHTDPSQLGPGSSSTIRVAGEFGVLSGLSVFADGGANSGAFVSSGLKHYFGEIRIAQQQPRRPRAPEETGQVGSPETGQVGPGAPGVGS